MSWSVERVETGARGGASSCPMTSNFGPCRLLSNDSMWAINRNIFRYSHVLIHVFTETSKLDRASTIKYQMQMISVALCFRLEMVESRRIGSPAFGIVGKKWNLLEASWGLGTLKEGWHGPIPIVHADKAKNHLCGSLSLLQQSKSTFRTKSLIPH